MLWLYRLLFVPALLVVAPRYLLRMRRRGGYRSDFGHRFGRHPVLPPKDPRRPRVWLQAVSVGEMLAISPILEALHRDGAEVYLTTTTSTGYRLAQDRYRALTVGVGYFPIDWWAFARAAWRRIQPDLVILTEGERWPEHLRQAALRRVPVLGINARMSERSFGRLRRFPAAARLMLGGVSRLLPCSVPDAARFRELGTDPAKVVMTGNIKLDVRIPRLTPAEKAQLRRELGLPEGLVIVGASTWPGEESALLSAWRAAREEGMACSLLIVPRHAERRDEIEALLGGASVRHHFRSRGAATERVDVAVGDTTGELRRLLQLGDVVFVGKSLPPSTEGQTPVEAAALEKPILFGPGMSNFREIAHDLVRCGAAHVVRDPDDLVRQTSGLLRDSVRRSQMADAAATWHRRNAGAVDRTWHVIRAELATIRENRSAFEQRR